MIEFKERRACPACGAEIAASQQLGGFALKTEEWAKRTSKFYDGRLNVEELADDRFVVMRCKACSLVYSRFHLDDAGMRHLYENCARSNLNYQEEVRRVNSLVRRSVDIVDAILGPPKVTPRRILDYGAGRGIWAKEARSRGYDVTAIELSSERIDEIRGQGVVASPCLTHSDLNFSFIYMSQVLEHLCDPLRTLTDISSRCRRDAVLLIGVPNGARVEKKLQTARRTFVDLYPEIDPFEHINCFSAKSMSELMRHAGFRAARPTDARTLTGAGVIFGVRLHSLSNGAPGRFFVKA